MLTPECCGDFIILVKLKFASLRQSAVVDGVDMKAQRGLDEAPFTKLVAGDWIARHQSLLVCGPTGTGKSWLACALGHKACRDDHSVLYHRVPRLFDALALARGDGRHARLLKSLARVELLILDDWGAATLTPEQGRDWSKSERVRLPNLKPSTTSISLRLPVILLERIKVAANKRDVPYQSLIKTLLAQKTETR
jgi:DNA replication protein DnaC